MQGASHPAALLVLHTKQLAGEFLQLEGAQFDQTLGFQEFGDAAAQFAVKLASALFQHAPFREVASDLGKTTQNSSLIAESGDDDVGPEGGAVFANAKAFIDEASFFSGKFEFALGPAALASLFGIEAGKMLANDLIGRVTLDSFGALIPGSDLPVSVEKEDSVIFDAVDEQAEDLITLLEAVLRVLIRLNFC